MKNIVMQQIIAVSNAALTLLTIGLLIFLIIKKSPRTFGNYKYLMLIFSAFNCIFAVIDVTDQPMAHFFKSGFIVFSRNAIGLPHYFASVYVALNCSLLGEIICLLCFHFIYRYFAVCKPHFLYLFKFPYYFSLVFTFIFISLSWWIIAAIVAGETDEKNAFWRDSMLDAFGLKVGEFAYVSLVFRRDDYDDGFNLSDIWFLIILSVITITGLILIIFLGMKIREILHKKSNTTVSRRTYEMQHQLFHALIAQTVIPLCFIFLPASTYLIVPIFQLKIGAFENCILPFITSYPFLDAVSSIYYIKVYRKSITEIFCKSQNTNVLHVSWSQKESRV